MGEEGIEPSRQLGHTILSRARLPIPTLAHDFSLILSLIWDKINLVMARVFSVCNQKGGVGKTTTTINLAAYLATLGKKSLIVDFDPQGNATSGLGITPHTLQYSVYHSFLGGVPFDMSVRKTEIPHLDILPANSDLAGALVELIDVEDREFLLRRLLSRVRHQYAYVFIDLPPSLSLLTLNGLVASDEVLIPIQTEYYSLQGLGELLRTITLINTNLKTNLKIGGALLTMYNRREVLSREVAKEVRRHFPYRVFNTVIPRSIALAEAPSFKKPIILHDRSSQGARAYESLAREIIADEQKKPQVHNFVAW